MNAFDYPERRKWGRSERKLNHSCSFNFYLTSLIDLTEELILTPTIGAYLFFEKGSVDNGLF
jgi:hypothetical protein